MQDFPAHENDFEGLLALRDRIEPYRNLLRARLKELEPRKAELQREIAQLGPKPAADEAPQLAALRHRLASEQESFETMYRQNLLVSQQSEALWDRITEMRRVLFSTRLTMHVSSIFDPIFWKDLIEFQIPWFGVRTTRLLDRWGDHIRANNNLGSAIGLLASSAVLVVFFVWIHNVLTSRRRAAELKHDAITELDVIKRGSLLLLMRSAPLTLAMLLFNLLVRRLNVAPPDVDNFLLSIAVAIFVMSATRGVMGALLSPTDPQWRLLRARDDTAKIISRMVVGSVDLYTLGIVLTSYQRLVEARVPIAIFTIIVITTAMLALAVHGFRQLGRGSAPVHGFIEIRMGWVRPIIVIGCAACGLALLFGYVALAGFMSGRITISAASVAVAILVVASLNYLFEQELLGETKWGGAFAEFGGRLRTDARSDRDGVIGRAALHYHCCRGAHRIHALGPGIRRRQSFCGFQHLRHDFRSAQLAWVLRLWPARIHRRSSRHAPDRRLARTPRFCPECLWTAASAIRYAQSLVMRVLLRRPSWRCP